MTLTKSDQHKISLVNNLNEQRSNNLFCDVEISHVQQNQTLFAHSIILNLYSEVMAAVICNKRKSTSFSTNSLCKVEFPNEFNFLKTNCFNCLKEIINYLYSGEIHYNIGHEDHIRDIVFNLKIIKLIQLFTVQINSLLRSSDLQHSSVAKNIESRTTTFVSDDLMKIHEKATSQFEGFNQEVVRKMGDENITSGEQNASRNINLNHSMFFENERALPNRNEVNQCEKYQISGFKIHSKLVVGTDNYCVRNETLELKNNTNASITLVNEHQIENLVNTEEVSHFKMKIDPKNSVVSSPFEQNLQHTFVETQDKLTTFNERQSENTNRDITKGQPYSNVSNLDIIYGEGTNHNYFSRQETLEKSDGLHLLLSILEQDTRRENDETDDSSVNKSRNTTLKQTNTIASTNFMCQTENFESDKCPQDEEQDNNCNHGKHERVVHEMCEEIDIHQTQKSANDSVSNIKKDFSNSLVCSDESLKLVETNSRKIKRKRKLTSKPKDNLVNSRVIGVNDGYMCKKCKMFFDNITLLQEHMESTHSKKFKCIACGLMTYKIRYFIDHLIQNKHEGTTCSICLHQTTSNEELNKHILKHSDNLGKPFFCNNCDKRFPTKRTWSMHLPMHSNEPQFLCAVCSKGFKWSQGLDNHMSTHMKEKMYLCDKCDFNTANRTNLMKHALKHYDKKAVCPYEECKHKEIWKENFKAHLLTHSKVKKFQCELCGKSFAQAKNMSRHLESVHSPRVVEFNCNQCNYITNRLDKLKDHFKSRHKGYDYTHHVEHLRDTVKKIKSKTCSNKVNKYLTGKMELLVQDKWESSKCNANNVENMNMNTMVISNAPPLLKNNIGNIITLPVINKSETLSKKMTETVEKTNKVIQSQDKVDPQIMTSVSKMKKTDARNKPAITRKLKAKNVVESVKPQRKPLKKILPLIKTPSELNSVQANAYLMNMNAVDNDNQFINNNVNNVKNIKFVCTNNTNSVPILLLVSNINKTITGEGKIMKNDEMKHENYAKTILHNDTTSKMNSHNSSPLLNGNTTEKNIFNDTSEVHRTHSDTFIEQLQTENDFSKENDKCLIDHMMSMDNIQNYMGARTNFLQVENRSQNTMQPAGMENSLIQHSVPETGTSGNYFDVLDESTGELLLLSSKYVNNPFLDEETGELCVFQIPSSIINYIENITNEPEPPLLDIPIEPLNETFNEDFNDFSYHNENFDFLLNETISQWPNFSQDSNNSFILNELTGELKVTTNQDGRLC